MNHTVIKSNKAKPQQITLYYNPNDKKHLKTLVQAESIAEVLAIPFSEVPTANNIWTNVWKHIEDDPLTVFDKSNPKFKELDIEKNGKTYEDWRKIVLHYPELLISPIAMSEQGILICHRPTEIHQFAQVKSQKLA